MGPVAPRHVGSSQTRARTCVACIGRRILNHCTTREAPVAFLFAELLFVSVASDIREGDTEYIFNKQGRTSLVVQCKNPPANAGDTGSSPGPGNPHMPQSK